MTEPTEAEIRAADAAVPEAALIMIADLRSRGLKLLKESAAIEHRRVLLRLLDEARADAEANRRDAEQGWAAFYALRKAVSADKYPTLTQIVRIKDAEAAMQEPGCE